MRLRTGLRLNALLILCITLGGFFTTTLDISIENGRRLTIEDELKQTAMIAADYLLQQAISPELDELTWPMAFSPSQNATTTFNFELYIINKTLGQVEDEAVVSIAIGDADNDGDNDIVLGTKPKGLVVFYENIATNYTAQFTSSLIANFSNQYGRYPMEVGDIIIGDIENTGNNKILVGTSYYETGYTGDIFSFEKSVNEWTQSEAFNGLANPVIGGVYSLVFGEVGQDSHFIVALGNGISDRSNVTIYSKVQDTWEATRLVATNQSRVQICIGDYDPVYDGNEIIYCTYDDNSTLGYIAYESGSYFHHIIDRYLIEPADPPPYTRFMNIEIGDFEGDGSNELTVAIDEDVVDQDKIKFYSDTSNITVIDNIEYMNDVGFEFDDFDNDGRDEVIYCYTNSTLFPTTYLMVYDWNNTENQLIFLETTIETFVSAMKTGNVDLDDDIEFLYGTDGNGWLRLWDHPKYSKYSFEKLAFNVSFIQHKPWVYEGETYPFTVTLQYIEGVNSVYDINLTPILPEFMDYLGPSLWIDELNPGSKRIFNFNLRSTTFGSYTLTMRIAFQQFESFELFEVHLPVIPRFPLQAHTGQSLLELALYTEDEKYLEAAVKVGNWLDSVGIPSGNYRAWNLNPNWTEILKPGYILSTARSGQYFLNLYLATEDIKFLTAALDAANFLADPEEGNFTQVVDMGITWGFSENAVAETSEVGKFLMKIMELGVGNFSEALTGIEDYFLAIANHGEEMINWFESPGLTQIVGNYFVMRGTEGQYIAEQAANWIANKINTNTSWFTSLSPSMYSNELYMRYKGTGLAGIGQFLIDIENKINKSYSDDLEKILTRLLNITYITEKGINWYSPIWTTNITDLLSSINFKWGAAGIASFLINLYNKTEKTVFRTYAIGASQWINASLPIIKSFPDYQPDTIETFADNINALIKILYIISPPIPLPTSTTSLSSTTSTTIMITSTSSTRISTTTPTTKSTIFPGLVLFILYILTIFIYRRKKRSR